MDTSSAVLCQLRSSLLSATASSALEISSTSEPASDLHKKITSSHLSNTKQDEGYQQEDSESNVAEEDGREQKDSMSIGPVVVAGGGRGKRQAVEVGFMQQDEERLECEPG